MIDERIEQLVIRTAQSGSIELEQADGCGNIETVFLHPIHLRYLFERVGLAPSPLPSSELERRLAVLSERINALAGTEWIRGEIIDRCGGGSEILGRLDAVADLASEMAYGLCQSTTDGDQGESNGHPLPTNKAATERDGASENNQGETA